MADGKTINLVLYRTNLYDICLSEIMVVYFKIKAPDIYVYEKRLNALLERTRREQGGGGSLARQKEWALSTKLQKR